MDKFEDTSLRRTFAMDYGGVYNTVRESLALSNYRKGSENAHFKQTISDKGNATTALSAGRQIGYYKPGLVEFGQSWPVFPNGRDGSGGIVFSSLIATSGSAKLADAAVARANSKYFSKLADLRLSVTNGQEFLGEIKETLEFMRSPFKSGVRILENLFTLALKNPANKKKFLRTQKMKHNPNSIFRSSRDGAGSPQTEIAIENSCLLLKDVGSQWLEVRFGLLPLIKDIAAFSELATTTARQERMSTHRCFGFVESSVPDVTEMYSRIYGVKHYYSVKRKSKAECSIRFGYLEKALTALEVRNQMIQETFGNLNQLPATLWELIPMSCFVDYFVNVGEMLQSVLESQTNVPWISKSVILTDEVDYLEIECTCAVQNQTFAKVKSLCELGIYSRTVKRTTTPVGISPMVFSIPSSPIRLTNLAALLSSFL